MDFDQVVSVQADRFPTAADLAQRTGDAERAMQHREHSGATILGLANSLPADHRLRATFLSATPVSRILSHHQAS